MENVAAQHYTERMKKNHRKIRVTTCELFVSKGRSYFGVSPDRLVSCDRCEPDLLEKKCSFRCAATAPSPQILEYLEDTGGLIRPKKHNRMYFQVQGQMAICCCRWYDTFIFSHHGYHLERVEFDAPFATEMLLKVPLFWESFVSPVFQEISNDTIIASTSNSSAHQSLETDDAPAAVPSTEKQTNQFPMPPSLRSSNPNNDIETLLAQPMSLTPS